MEEGKHSKPKIARLSAINLDQHGGKRSGSTELIRPHNVMGNLEHTMWSTIQEFTQQRLFIK